ncbi:lipopolysaccharide assembly protein LapA domain-containing protein [Trichococcus sp. K1Tr]|uniref:lipopolysaccharide assembly protein LapA domain-containing protein n=1 Tax=Trichococcus sp. K1Tr TaxID=3020847 RepID=UPI00232C182D|nr:lipopolysaccharide assembly protein LapA domain-containing protein [Trichococcus sp. K1Tr]MDB6352055.1 lipopolysaccharide assembly protein LapA domain-containing protein [Trichococcus sp. K1Tr]
MKNQWRLVAGIILIIIIVLFAVFNVDSVPVNFGFAVVDGPLIIVILVSLLMGSLITLLVATGSATKKNKEFKQMRAEINTKGKEIQNAVDATKVGYEQQIADLRTELTQKDNKINSLEEELIKKFTGGSPDQPSGV